MNEKAISAGNGNGRVLGVKCAGQRQWDASHTRGNGCVYCASMRALHAAGISGTARTICQAGYGNERR